MDSIKLTGILALIGVGIGLLGICFASMKLCGAH